MFCVKVVSKVTGPSGKPTAISTQPKRGQTPHHHVEAAVDGCNSGLFAVKNEEKDCRFNQ